MKSSLFVFLLFFTCNALFATTFYLDPVNGDLANNGSSSAPWSSFEEVVNAGYIVSNSYSPLPYDPVNSVLVPKNLSGFVHAGDTLILLDGLHGDIFMRGYHNHAIITVKGADGHQPIIDKIRIQSGKNWKFENLNISTEPAGYYAGYHLAYVETHSWHGPSSNVHFDNCELYSTDTPWTSAQEWIDLSSDGIYLSGDSCSATNCLIRNINMGITANGNYITADNNQIINFSGDGMRVLGSNILFRHNLIKNCYDVDENHDDGIQSFVYGGTRDSVQLIGNTIINTDDLTRPLNGPLQGIGCFDGFFNDWIVENNLIYVNHYHGITFLGANNIRIINNTVIDPTPDVTPGASWIRVADHKDGTPSTNILVANNIANAYTGYGVHVNNATINTYAEYAANFQDYAMSDFHLLPSSLFIDAADPTYAPSVDIENNSRFADLNPDIGAYEYVCFQQVDSVFESSCDLNEVGQFIDTLQNNTGCDSLVIRTVYNSNLDMDFHVCIEGVVKEDNSMRTSLYDLNLLPGQGTTPSGQPYNHPYWGYTGTEGANYTTSDYSQLETLYNSKPIDWVLVSFRSDVNATSTLGRTAGILMANGQIHFPDRCLWSQNFPDSLYFLIEHRNHMGIMTSNKLEVVNNSLSHDFRLADSYKNNTSTGQVFKDAGIWCMVGSVGAQNATDPSYQVNGEDKALWLPINGFSNLYSPVDYDLNGDINGGDKAFWTFRNGLFSSVPR